MKTQQRLTAAYRDAHVVEYDDDSRFVWLSDSHRGDGSLSDEFLKNRNVFVAALEHYDAEGFTLVEAGDNDDLWEFNPRHIIKAHGVVFETLKKFHDGGRYLRMFGNHDIELRDPKVVARMFDATEHPLTRERLELMPGLKVHESILLRHRTRGHELLTVHGHQGDFSNDQNWRFTRVTFRLFWRWLHAFGIHSPSSPVRNSFKRHKVERNYTKWISRHHTPLICGHTHREKFPRPGQVPYFNTGACVYPSYITALELTGDELSLVGWRVEPDADRTLRVHRTALMGPRRVDSLGAGRR